MEGARPARQGRCRALPTDRVSTEVVQRWLGVDPFVLITFKSYDESTDELALGVEFGGGVTQDDLRDIFGSVLESLEP
jgi:hypothetical protein